MEQKNNNYADVFFSREQLFSLPIFSTMLHFGGTGQDKMERRKDVLRQFYVYIRVYTCVCIDFLISLQRNILYVMLDVGKTDRPAWIGW